MYKQTIYGCMLFMLGLPVWSQAEPVLERASAAVFSRPHDLVLGPDGRYLFVADVGNHAVRVLDPDTLAIVGQIGAGELRSPHDVCFDPQGRLLVADSGNDRIAVYAVAGNAGTLQEVWGEGLSSPEGVAVAGDGVWYVTNARSHTVVKRAADAVQIAGGRGDYSRPHDIDIGPDGRIYVVDAGNDRVQILSTALEVVATLGGPGFDFNDPKYIAFDQQNRLYLADEYNNQVKIFSPDRQLLATIGGLNQPEGAAVSANALWVSDTYNNRILRYRLDE